MNRFLISVGAFLSLFTMASLVGMFADLERIEFWALGLGIGIALLIVWAPLYLVVRTRTERAQAAASEPVAAQKHLRPTIALSSITWGVVVVFVGALATLLVSLAQVIVFTMGPGSGWGQIGVGAFLVLVVCGPILVLAHKLTKPTPATAPPFVAEEDLPMGAPARAITSDSSSDEHEAANEWPYASVAAEDEVMQDEERPYTG